MIFELYDEDPTGLPITETNIIKTVNESMCHPEKIQIIMMRNGEENIGYGMLNFSWSNENGGDVVNIDELYVKKGYRNNQVGSNFIKRIMETYTNAVLFEIETTPSNKGALKLYMNNGFEISANTHLIYKANQIQE